MPTLRKNLFYSILLVLANYVFPFLTYPYVSRVLGVTGIGACNFVDSIINYFILFSTLGIDTLGIREIAKNKGDKEALNQVFSNLIIVNLVLTGVMLLLLAIATLTVPQLAAHKDLLVIGAFKLVFNCLLMEWLFKGLEDFKLITLRSIAVKTVYVVSVFLFVRSKEDVGVYYLISSLVVVANALVNLFLAPRRVRLTCSGIHFFPTFKSLLSLGIYAILTSMYTTFNVFYLGLVSGDEEVGFYANATKIYYMVMAVFTAFTGVMLPRMSELVSAGKIDQFKSYFHMAVDILFGFSFPIIIWMTLMAPEIIYLISGPEFDQSALPMIIISPLVFIIGYEQILVLQTLLPMGRDKLLLRNSIIGAVVGILLNVVLVPKLAAIGSSIVWVVTEVLILVLSQVAVRRMIQIEFPYKETGKNLLVYLPLIALVSCCCLIPSSFLKLGVATTIVAVYIFVYQIIIRKRELLINFQ